MRNYIFLFISVIILLSSCAKPISDFTYKIDSKFLPAKVNFNNNSKDADSYEWDFGDGKTSNKKSPTHKYKSSGNYTVTLKAIKGKKANFKKYEVSIAEPEKCLIELETEFGSMVIELYDATPKHRDNFIKLVEDGFYDGLLFHRVIDGFMIQGGDPNSKNAPKGKALGSGDIGYQIPAEFVDSLIHLKGTLCAARNNNPQKKSSGCQFYIVQGKPVPPALLDKISTQRGARYGKYEKEAYKTIGGTPQLDGNYTVFGRVIEGIEVIDKIAKVKTDARDRPEKDVKMKVRIMK